METAEPVPAVLAGADTSELKRTKTDDIRQGFQSMGRASLGGGLCVAVINSSMAAAFIVYSVDIPDTCESNMKPTFLGMGICSAVSGILSLISTWVAKEMFTAMSHKALAEKWADTERAEESRREEAAFQHDLKRTQKHAAGLVSLSCLVILGSVAFGIYGIVQAAQGTDENCGGSITVYWVLFCINSSLSCLTSCGRQFCQKKKDSGAGQSEDGEVVGARA